MRLVSRGNNELDRKAYQPQYDDVKHMGSQSGFKKSKIPIFILIVFLIGLGYVYISNIRPVYFIDGVTGEKTKLTSFWLMQNEIEIKDKWFNDFDQEVISGIIYIEEDEKYAIIPYTYTKFDNDFDLSDLYNNGRSRFKGVFWTSKNGDEPLSFSVENKRKLLVAVGTYSGTSYDRTEYGIGVYIIPLYNNHGNLITFIRLTSESLVDVRSGFNDDIPSYILQEVIFTEVSITNHEPVTFLLPVSFVGGLRIEDIGESDHYYYEYNGNDIILEATFIPIQE